MGKYSEIDRPILSVAWRIILAVLAVTVVIGLITWGVRIVTAGTSEARGQLDKTITINAGDNQIKSQELFEDLYAKIKEYDRNLDVAAAAVKRDPSPFNQTNYEGLKMQCNSAIEEYNAAANKISKGKWMDPRLPYQIDVLDPISDCKETAQ